MNVLILGAQGQLGRELQITAPDDVVVSAFSRAELDITNADAINHIVQTLQPQWIINASAYNAVDKAETDIDTAFAINAQGPANLARAASLYGARLVHVSTDYVFDGHQCTPYSPLDLPNPLNQYGLSKWQGEKLINEIYPEQSFILRTSWVYSKHGKNFVKNLLELLRQRDSLTMTIDQVGSPSWAKTLAQVVWIALEKKLTGIYHWSDEGLASRYDFASSIQEEAYKLRLLTKKIFIKPILTAEFPLPARRPSYSVLDKSLSYEKLNLKPIHWQDSLQEMLLDFSKAN